MMTLPTTSAQISLFAQSPTYCAVCAPLTASPEIIETVVALRNRGEPEAEWKVLTGPFAEVWPNPRACPHDEHRRHWLVMRVSA